MIRRTEEIKDLAQECRRLARATNHELVREELLEVAERFERLARHRRHSEKQNTRSPKVSLPINAP